jgi:N-acetylglucosamine kinase-like BadF-type ATPase
VVAVSEYVVGVDAGNSKTDVVVATLDGRLLARRRGPGVDSPYGRIDAWRSGLLGLVEATKDEAGVSALPVTACFYLANLDLPDEHELARAELVHMAGTTVVGNDTLAVMTAGARRGWGIGVVAGAGVNAVGVGADGRTEGFLALGDYTGDIGGGHWLGMKAIAAAVRAGDGRGPATSLRDAVAVHFGMSDAEAVAVAVHRGRIDYDDELHPLAPSVLATAAAGDAVAARLVAEFGDEVVVMVTSLIRRLDLSGTDVEVVLGGGVLQGAHALLQDRIVAGVAAVEPAAQVRTLDVAPVYGAVATALRTAGADPSGLDAMRTVLRQV